MANAHRFYVPVGVVSLAVPPSAPSTGDTYFDTVLGQLRSWDGSVWVGTSSDAVLGARFVDAIGDTMTGELFLPDQIVVPPSTPVAVSAKGYVDQLATVSDAPPVAAPARDGLVWAVVGVELPPHAGTNWEQRPIDWIPNTRVASGDQKIGMLIHVLDGDTGSASFRVGVAGAAGYTVDWGDGAPTENFATNADATHAYDSMNLPTIPLTGDGKRQTWCIVTPQAGGTLSFLGIATGADADASEIIFGPNVPSITGGSGAWQKVAHVDFLDTWAPVSCGFAFTEFKSLISITGNIDTSNSANFGSMFSGCSSLTTVPLFDTSDGTDFNSMFRTCGALVNVPALNTVNGKNFSSMFNGCTSLQTIPALNTDNGTNFSYMFYECRSLQTIPALNTVNGTSFEAMFNNCQALAIMPPLVTTNGTNFSSMFANCTIAMISPFDTTNGTNFSYMFSGCIALTSSPVSNTSNGTNFTSMFIGCVALETVSPLDTSNGTGFGHMFDRCTVLTFCPISNTSSGTNFTSMFSNSGVQAIPALDCSQSTNSTFMFSGDTSLTSIGAFGFTTSVGLTGCALDAPTLDTFFSNLGTAVAGAEVNITNNPGVATCDRTLATEKGWIVTG